MRLDWPTVMFDDGRLKKLHTADDESVDRLSSYGM